MCVEQTSEEIKVEMEEGFRQIEADRVEAEDAATEEYYNDRRNDVDDCEDECPDEPT